jgi:hypothetical protein
VKPNHLLARTVTLGVLALGCAQTASARQAPVSRADLSGTVGWLAVNKEPPGEFDYSDDWQDSLFAAATAGWYWSDHLKTELEFGAGTEAAAFRSRQIVVGGRPISEFVESQYTRRTLALGQHYQFFRNAWFHPYVGAGLNVTAEQITDRTRPVIVYDDPRGPRVIRPEQVVGPRTDVFVSPFAAAGFKAYLTQRGFFRSDLKLTLRDGVDEVLVRFGFGVDF